VGLTEWMLLLAIAGLLPLAWRLLGPGQRVIVNERGILARDLDLGWIRWESIEGVYPPSARDSQALHLRLRLDERLSRRLGRRGADAGPAPRPGETYELRLDLEGARLSPVELLQEIVAHGPTRESRPV
jgi:hypothetical protein